MIISTNTGETLKVDKLPTFDLTTNLFFVKGWEYCNRYKMFAQIPHIYSFTDYQLNPTFKGSN